jgi:hypothetical protein
LGHNSRQFTEIWNADDANIFKLPDKQQIFDSLGLGLARSTETRETFYQHPESSYKAA